MPRPSSLALLSACSAREWFTEGYVNRHISEAHARKQPANRTTHMVAMRQQIKAEFLKSLPGIKTCKNCKGYAYVFGVMNLLFAFFCGFPCCRCVARSRQGDANVGSKG